MGSSQSWIFTQHKSVITKIFLGFRKLFSCNDWYAERNNQVRSSIYSLYQVKACNELARLIYALLRLQATQIFPKKRYSGGELLAIMCPIWPARGLDLRLPTPETNKLPLDQLVIKWEIIHQFIDEYRLSSMRLSNLTNTNNYPFRGSV